MLSNVTVCGLGLGLTVWSAGLCREAGLFFPIREAGHVRVSCSLIEVCFRWPAKCRPVPMFRGIGRLIIAIDLSLHVAAPV